MTVDSETPKLVEAATSSTEPSTELEPVVEPCKPKRKTRRSRRSAYRRKKQEQKRLAAEAAASNCDTSTTCTESETSSSCSETYGNGNNSPQRCARRRNNRNRRNHYHSNHQNMNMNVPFYVWPHQQPMYYDYSPYVYCCEELSVSSGDGYNYRFGNKQNYRNLPLRVEVETLAEKQQNQYVALDCEMVGVGCEGVQSALARVTIIDWHGNVLMDEYVKQQQKVTDYRTFVSGITKEILDEAKVDFATCRRRVQDILKGKILVGHALKNDLGVLGIRHPWHMTRDTATYEPFMKVRFTDGVLWPRGLKDLCKEKLDRDIQAYGKPHCPREDALAALDLYRTVWQDWEKSMAFKISQN